MVIRNVVVGRLRQETDPEAAVAASAQLDRGLAGIGALRVEGLMDTHIGRDLGLRPGGWTFAITNDWADEDAYRVYDSDPEHLRYRQMIVEVCAEVVRVQFSSTWPRRSRPGFRHLVCSFAKSIRARQAR